MKDHYRHGVVTNTSQQGTLYYFDKVTNVGLLDIINKTDEELMHLFYPKDNIEGIRNALIKSIDK